jgi:tRNA A37 threonylcarbamoyladenosine synthetase subunit TsaC/SUA5/YrdC
MDRNSSTVYLTNTDTTVGFISQDASRLDDIKMRTPDKQYIIALPSLSALKRYTRTPVSHANRIRRSRRTTFIMPDGCAYRIIRDRKHLWLIKRLGWAYTTSANASGKEFDEKWARAQADKVIEPVGKSTHDHASNIYILGKKGKIRKIR